MLWMKWVSRNRRMRTSYVMHKSQGVKYPERCYEVHTASVVWTADEINYGRKFWGRRDEGEGVPERGRAKEREESSGKHEVVSMETRRRKLHRQHQWHGGSQKRRLCRRRLRQ